MQHSVIGQDVGMAYTANPAKKDIEAIIAKHSDLVTRIAWHVHSRMSSAIEVSDLIQIGMIALVEGARNFEDRGIDFSAYASTRIRGAMIDELRREAKISRSGMINKKRLTQIRKRLFSEHGREPSPTEIAKEMNIPVEEYYTIEASANAWQQESIDDTYSDHDMWFADLTADPFDDLERAYTARKLAACIAQLPEKKAQVLQLYFVEELNLEEIGCTLGVGAARICQIKKKALEELKELWTA